MAWADANGTPLSVRIAVGRPNALNVCSKTVKAKRSCVVASASRPRRTSCNSKRASIPSSTNSIANGRTRRSRLKVPADLYAPSLRPYRGLTDLTYPFHDHTIAVTHCGRLCFKGRKVNLSHVFAGQNVGVTQVSERLWLVTFMQYDLGYFDDETCRLEPIENPFGPKVLPMSPE